MIALHEYFRLYDRDETCFLAQCRIAGQSLSIGFDTALARNTVSNGDHRAPLCKAGAHLKVFFEPVAQSVQSFGDFLTGMSCQILCAGIDFDARNDSRVDDGPYERGAILFPLADGFVVKDCAADALAEERRGDDQLPIGAPCLLGLRNPLLDVYKRQVSKSLSEIPIVQA